MKKATTLLLTALTVGSLVGPAGAALIAGQTIGIDFDDAGNTTGSGSEANFLIVSDANTAPVAGMNSGAYGLSVATDITGAGTGGVTVDITGFIGFMGESTIGFRNDTNGDYGSYPFSSLTFNDGVYHNAAHPSYDQVAIEITFHGLDDSLQYDVTGLVNGGNTYTATGTIPMFAGGTQVDNSGALTSQASDAGTLTPSIINGVSTDGSGNLTVSFWEAGVTGWGGLGGLSVTAVPEPATLGLLGLAFGGLMMVRRKRK